MQSLCKDDQLEHLLRLVNYVKDKKLTGTQAWGAFSAPLPKKAFKPKTGGRQFTLKFSLSERKTFNSLRESVQIKLYQEHGRSCAYCRRPVGHYGYDWHIEHVLPKSKFGAHTFRFDNLTIGCVHCNRWKGVHVDNYVVTKNLPIINPVQANFQYSDHLRYLQFGTEELSFAKYSPKSPEGIKTYELLRLDELERVHTINSMDGISAAFHERITRAMSAGLTVAEGQSFLKLLSDLKSSVYRRPQG
jgi:uncharacterized protein (TIGR02646 family)